MTEFEMLRLVTRLGPQDKYTVRVTVFSVFLLGL